MDGEEAAESQMRNPPHVVAYGVGLAVSSIDEDEGKGPAPSRGYGPRPADRRHDDVLETRRYDRRHEVRRGIEAATMIHELRVVPFLAHLLFFGAAMVVDRI